MITVVTITIVAIMPRVPLEITISVTVAGLGSLAMLTAATFEMLAIAKSITLGIAIR
jgi:hypothetical protein